MRPLPLSLLLLALPACASRPPPKTEADTGQCLSDAVAMICDVDRLASLSSEAEPLAVGQKRSAWLAARVENPDGIELETRLSVKGAADQAKMIREKAREVGLRQCALADSLERDGAGGLSP
jgi:hypothetical protein